MTMSVKQLPVYFLTVIFFCCVYAPIFCQDVNDHCSSNALVSKAMHSRTPLIPANPSANDRDNTMVLLDSVYDARWNPLMNGAPVLKLCMNTTPADWRFRSTGFFVIRQPGIAGRL
jgi:hypothetical protein